MTTPSRSDLSTRVDIRPRWTIQKNPPHLPVNAAKRWAIFETAARLRGEPLMERFQSAQRLKRGPQRTRQMIPR